MAPAVLVEQWEQHSQRRIAWVNLSGPYNNDHIILSTIILYLKLILSFLKATIANKTRGIQVSWMPDYTAMRMRKPLLLQYFFKSGIFMVCCHNVIFMGFGKVWVNRYRWWRDATHLINFAQHLFLFQLSKPVKLSFRKKNVSLSKVKNCTSVVCLI